MESRQLPHPGDGHRRTKTEFKTSVLRSFIHKRLPSDGTTLAPLKIDILTPTTVKQDVSPSYYRGNDGVLGELHHNNQQQGLPSPTKSIDFRFAQMAGGKSLHRKGLSSISLKAMAGRDNDKEDKPKKPKKSKSSTNLANLLSRPKASKNAQKVADEEARAAKDKENRTPRINSEEYARPTPIYAQFARQSFTTQPGGGKFLEDEVQVYTPDALSPNKQGYFDLPTTGDQNKGSPKPRTPSTTWLPSGLSIKDIEKRRVSRDMRNSFDLESDRTSADTRGRESSTETRPSLDRKTTSTSAKTEFTFAQRSSRALYAVWPHKKEAEVAAEVEKPKPFSIDPENIDTELEAMLDRRNIPENSRHKMRRLARDMKVELIRQDWAEIAAAKNNASVSTNSSRPGTRSSEESAEILEISQEKNDKKKSRPLSMTFSKGKKDPPSSPKKGKSDGTFGRHKRTKSADSTTSAKSLASTSSGVASTIIAKAKGQLPDDFVAYLQKGQKPELVEVGRLHKLRLLLRNEMVAWTDTFITLGGMAEIIALLRRIMAVEWREEHEDNLLHEVLLCLKALCTTALAQKHLADVQNTLFPELLAMVFDEERKGPAEFTTRNIISDLMFTYLKSAPLKDRSKRARTLLSYLRDRQKEEDERPIGFVLEMRRERPYQVWCKEAVNVTKEVFWIFLHNLNVIALPSAADNAISEANLHTTALAISLANPELTVNDVIQHYGYMLTHFPTDRPPVAAAPYVGGVEWDATNYLASHLDLLNGIIASLPTVNERNDLRELLRLSGWEKVMGVSLRTCKEKFYGGVHCGLRTWVKAGVADGWNVKDTRQGPTQVARSPVRGGKGGVNKVVQAPPMLEIPKLELGGRKEGDQMDAWL